MKRDTRLRIILSILTLSVLLLTAARTEAAITYLKSWGIYGSGDGQFDWPRGVSVAPGGEVYIADTNNNRIQKFTSNGEYLANFGNIGSGNGEFYHPFGLAVSTAGEIYVADSGNNRIQRFNSNGIYLTQFGGAGTGDGQFNWPHGVSVGLSGDVYVADTGNNRIQKFNRYDVFLSKTGYYGSGNGEFSNPSGIAVGAGGEVYVADSYNYRIQMFNSDLGYLLQFGGFGVGDGQFILPHSVSISAAGYIYVTDTENDRIQKFNSYGGFLTKFGTSGSGDGQLYYPQGVTVCPTGEIYVADTGNSRIQKWFDLDAWVSGTPHLDSAAIGPGQLLGAWLNLDSTRGLLIDGTLNIKPGGYLTQQGGNITTNYITNEGQLAVNEGAFVVEIDFRNKSSMIIDGGTIYTDTFYNDLGADLEARGTITLSSMSSDMYNYGTVTPTGVLTVNGEISNYGIIELDTGERLNGTGVVNNMPDGVIRGKGAVDKPLMNYGLIHANSSGLLGFLDFRGNLDGGEMRVDNASTLRVSFEESIPNEGLIVLGGATAVLSGSGITNSGTIQGQGRITNSIENFGNIRAEGGQLTLAGPIISNAGLIEVPTGGSVFVTQGLYPNSGQIALAGGAFDNNNHPLLNYALIIGHGTLRTGGLTNPGLIHFADGATNVFGAVINQASGESDGMIIIEGNDATIITFYGPVTNEPGCVFDILGGTVRFLGGETGVVNGGLLALSGSGQIDPQSAIENNDLFLISGSETHVVGAITGDGETNVQFGTELQVDLIQQNTLTIGAGAKVVIRPLTGGPLASGYTLQSVPEPPAIWLVMLAVLTWGMAKRKVS
jgi:sugar lactone lactonase YvrE